MTELIQHDTPIKEYRINSRTIFVKREDLSTLPPMPALAKMRGAAVLLQRLKEEGIRKIGVFDTAVSRAGEGIAYLCKELGLDCYVAYSDKKSGLTENLRDAFENGGIPLPIRPGRTPICYALAKRQLQKMGGVMLPQGLVCAESVDAVAQEAATVSTELLQGSLVVCTGTGTILAGILSGLSILPSIYGISACISNQKKLENIRHMTALCLPDRKYAIQAHLKLEPEIMDYYEACDIKTPFPCSSYYDKKAFLWLVRNLDILKDPIVFWNIGQK